MPNVKGVLFADYVRMVKARKDVDWSRHLGPQERFFLAQRIDPASWYPMSSFEALGNAILEVTAGGEMELVRLWGYHSADQLIFEQPMLLAPADPVETLTRFRVMRASYFDFEALQIPVLHEDEAEIITAYGMSARAEEAASWQALGFFERLLELASATDVVADFLERSWAGDPRTLARFKWTPRL